MLLEPDIFPCLALFNDLFMPWLCVDHMIYHEIWYMGYSYLEPLDQFRPTASVDVFTCEATYIGGDVISQNCFHQYFIYIYK